MVISMEEKQQQITGTLLHCYFEFFFICIYIYIYKESIKGNFEIFDEMRLVVWSRNTTPCKDLGVSYGLRPMY